MNSIKTARRDVKDVRVANTFRRTIAVSGLNMSLVSVQGAVLTLTLGAGIAVVGNVLTLYVSAEDMDIAPATYKYDLVMQMSNGDVFTLLEGDFVVSKSISVP
jgi:hypothetical protein